MTKTPAEELLIGAHTSAQGGAYKALLEGQEIGATTIQLFTRNQRQWAGKPFTEEELTSWQTTLKNTRLRQIMSHDSYLINLGSPNPELLHKSQKAFKEEWERCQKLGIAFLNFHPGAATGSTEEECLAQIVKSLTSLEPIASGGASSGFTRLLIEATAGQGTSVGHRFEHLAYILKHVPAKIPMGVCIDTCHIFSAGYDIRTPQAWEKTLNEFDRIVGLKHLYALHVNDSLKPLGARRDRHAPLGKGEIGIDCFKVMMTHPDLRDLPKYLETPDGPPLWKQEIQMLREFAK